MVEVHGDRVKENWGAWNKQTKTEFQNTLQREDLYSDDLHLVSVQGNSDAFFFYMLIKFQAPLKSTELCGGKDRHGNFSPAVEIPKHLCWHAELGSGSPNCQPCGGLH